MNSPAFKTRTHPAYTKHSTTGCQAPANQKNKNGVPKKNTTTWTTCVRTYQPNTRTWCVWKKTISEAFNSLLSLFNDYFKFINQLSVNQTHHVLLSSSSTYLNRLRWLRVRVLQPMLLVTPCATVIFLSCVVCFFMIGCRLLERGSTYVLFRRIECFLFELLVMKFLYLTST